MANRKFPEVATKLVANKLSQKFRDITEIVKAPLPRPKQGEVTIKNRYLGINASDINYTAGRYESNLKLPFDCGFEGLGEVIAVGDGSTLQPGQPVMYYRMGAFCDYMNVPEKHVAEIPSASPEFLTLMLSGPTAAIALDKFGNLKPGERVLVTAAAGGTGQFAVQWAKKKGCHVIGTCSTEEKVDLLKKLGCDRPINYKREDIKTVLKEEYKDGIDVVYESVGGDVFDTCLNSLRVGGRLIVIGFISGYQTSLGFQPSRTMASLPVRLLNKSASIHGFFLPHFDKEWLRYAKLMSEMYNKSELVCTVDQGHGQPTGPFIGLEKVADAVEYLYTQKSQGKIVVHLQDLKSNL